MFAPLYLKCHSWLLACVLCALTCLGQAETCLECHDDAEMTLDRDGVEVSIAVHPTMFEATAHDLLDCTDCHTGLDEEDLPHADPIPSAVVACLDCHEDLAASHAFHSGFDELDAVSLQADGVRCDSCHTAHRVLYRDDPDFPFARSRQTGHCGICHEEESLGYLHSAHAQALEGGADVAPACLGCHRSGPMTGADEFAAMPRKIRLAKLCVSCHVERMEVSGQTLYGTPFITSFEGSVHGQALYAGNEDAPTCIDCHDSHIVARASVVESHVSHGQVVASCSGCHANAAEDYLRSIHATAMGKGYLGAPDCTDCHGEHDILDHTDPRSRVAPANLAEQVCGECHGSVRLNKQYGMAPDRLSTFKESYHGLASRGGAVEVVNCASCHGHHDIRAGSNPASRVYPDNLAETCGSCHEGANERFAVGKVHVSVDTESQEPLLRWIATVYVWGIVLIIGSMVVHNGLDFFHKVREKAGTHWRHHEFQPRTTPHRLYLRMTRSERLQHGLLVLSFILLVITGFMLKYPEAWWVIVLRNLNSEIFELRGLTHRLAGVVMCLAGIWHVGHISLTERGRQLIKDLLPNKKDFADMKGVFLYNVGLAKQKPDFDRFTYMEKAEYWALIWGGIVMTVTGFLLWYADVTIGFATLLGFDISLVIHFYEAILATLAILVWHLYFVVFNPDVYPMNLSWLTGRMSEEEMETEHPLELAKIRQERSRRDADQRQ